MKLLSVTGLATVVLLLERSSAENLRLGGQREKHEASRALNGGTPCGNGVVGNTFCANPDLCCSQWGWCGTVSTGHCDGVHPMQNDVPCGNNVIGNGVCEDPSLCCSQYGYCGTAATGHCDGANPIPTPNDPPTAPPTPEPTPSPIIDDVPCGNSVIGNGVCEDPSLCCSQYGYCGTAATGHCDGTNPIPTPNDPPTAPPVPEPTPSPIMPVSPPDGPVGHVGENSRLIAYLGNWEACPTDQQLEQYTHIMIAFAVSYQWSSPKVICSQTCEITSPFVCGNAARPDLIQKWQADGKKVILSFGGALMGGSWATSVDDCWEYCYGRETQVVDRLVEIANEMGVDGVDIDYEYFYDDGQNGSGFSKGNEAQKFLKDVTLGLRDKLPTGSEVTHAPMDSDLVPGTGYYNVLQEVGYSLDFLMPQYYNGVVFAKTNFGGAVQHFENLKTDIFDGDASKIVFGFCISQCGQYNMDGIQAASTMESLYENFPCNGGAFFWMASHDVNGAWSIPVANEIQIGSDQCSANEVTASPTGSPTLGLTASPTMSPTASPTVSPTAGPTASPTTSPTVSPTGAPPTDPPADVPSNPPTDAPTNPPTDAPTDVPTNPPTNPPTDAPTDAPTNPPTDPPTDPVGDCVDDPNYIYRGREGDTCTSFVQQSTRRRTRIICLRRANADKNDDTSVFEYCKATCDAAGISSACA